MKRGKEWHGEGFDRSGDVARSDAVLRRADKALYEAKSAGRGRLIRAQDRSVAAGHAALAVPT